MDRQSVQDMFQEQRAHTGASSSAPASSPVLEAADGLSFPKPDGAGQSFATFLYNRKNERAFRMAQEMADGTRHAPSTPVVFCGESGCGKTHLLHAIALEMRIRHPQAAVFCDSVDALASLWGENPHANAFRHALMQFSALCLDDAHTFTRYPHLQKEFAAVLGMIRETGTPCILALNNESVLSRLDAELASLFTADTLYPLQKPDLDIRLRYATVQASLLGLEIKKEHLFTIARHFTSFHDLERFIQNTAAFRKKTTRPVAGADLDKILRHEDAPTKRPVTPEHIIAFIADNMRVSREDIIGAGRTMDVVLARQLSMYTCRTILGVPLTSLGAYFGGKNHATVVHACKKITQNIDSNKVMHTIITQARKKFACV